MSDETTANKGHDARNRINVNDKDEVTYWSKLFGVSEAELLATIDRVGPYVDDIAVDLTEKAA